MIETAAAAFDEPPPSVSSSAGVKKETKESKEAKTESEPAVLPPVRLAYVSTTTRDTSRRLDVQGICGSVGFELEFASLKPYYLEATSKRRKSFDGDWSKAVLGKDTTSGFTIELDKDHLEIVTDPRTCVCTASPATALSQVGDQVNAVARFIDKIRDLSQRDKHTFGIDRGVQTIDACKLLLERHQIDTVFLHGNGGTTPLGTMQATIGTTLARFPQLLAIEEKSCHRVAETLWAPYADSVIRDVADVRGLFFVCVYYIDTLQRITKEHTESDGLKTALPLLARTDFASMYRLLSSAGGVAFYDCITSAYAKSLAKPLVPGGWIHPSDRKRHYDGPSIGEWLLSIVKPTIRAFDRDKKQLPHLKDDLSPPEGYLEHYEGLMTYSMGKYGTISCACGIHALVLFELRDVANECPVSKFKEIAVDIARFAFNVSNRMEFRLPVWERAPVGRRRKVTTDPSVSDGPSKSP